MVLNVIDTKALVAACSHNKLEPNENGQYNVQEFTFKVKLGFQSNNCLDLFTLDIKERKDDDGKVIQESKSLSLVNPATAGEHARYIVTKLKPIDMEIAHAALTDKLKKRVANGALALTQCIDSHTFKLISNLPGPHPCVMLAHIMNSYQPVNVATKNELILAFNSFNAADPKHDGSFEMFCSNFNSLNNDLKVRGEPPKTIDTLKATFLNAIRVAKTSCHQGLD